MNPFTAIVGFLTKAVEGFNQWTNPENKRLRTVADYQKELIKARSERDRIIAKRPKDEDDKEKIAVELGIITNRIIWLRNKRDNLAR